MAININLNRTGLVNKRSEVGPYINKEHLNFESIGGQSRAILKESIWKEGNTFTTVTVYHGDTPLTEGTDYTVQNEAATITLLSTPEDNRYYASYYPGGSIIWAEDVNELQTAVQTIATDALDKTGDTMSGTLNMGNNIITNVNTVNGVKIETHNHSNGQGGLIPSSGIEDGAITTSKIASQAVETNKIKDLAVTNEKINSVNVGKIIGLIDVLRSYANTSLTNLQSGLENTICTENPTTIPTATIKKPVVISDAYRDSTTGSWYNIYSNGAIEMGGIVHVGTDSTASVIFPNGITLTDLNYAVQLTLNSSTTTMNNTTAGSIWYNTKTTNGFTVLNDLWDGDISWEVKGVVVGTSQTLLYSNYNISNGENIINTLYTYTVPFNQIIKVELGGAIGVSDENIQKNHGGGKLTNQHTYLANDILEIKSINSSRTFYNGFSIFNYSIGVALYCNGEIVLATGGGSSNSYYDSNTRCIGGSGYVGGAVFNNDGSPNTHTDRVAGYSFTTGSAGNSTELTGACGGPNSKNSQNVRVAYGGSGYIHPNFQSDPNIIVSGSDTTGNFNDAFAKLIAIS